MLAVLCAATLLLAAAAARAATLSFDPLFGGGDGREVFSFQAGPFNEVPSDLVVDPASQNTFVVGVSGADTAVWSFGPDGRRNTGFSGDGALLIDGSTNGGLDSGNAITIHDNRLVIAGSADVEPGVVLDVGATLSVVDLAGNVERVVQRNPTAGFDTANAVTVNSAGKAFAAGSADTDTLIFSNDVSTGASNDTFSVDGLDVRNFSGDINSDGANAIRLDASGNLVGAGFAVRGAGGSDTLVFKVDQSGELVNAFSGGVRLIDAGANDGAADLLVRPERIVVGGGIDVATAGGDDSVVIELNPGDGSVAPGGLQQLDLSQAGRDDFVLELASTQSGQVLIAGGAQNAAGQLDPVAVVAELQANLVLLAVFTAPFADNDGDNPATATAEAPQPQGSDPGQLITAPVDEGAESAQFAAARLKLFAPAAGGAPSPGGDTTPAPDFALEKSVDCYSGVDAKTLAKEVDFQTRFGLFLRTAKLRKPPNQCHLDDLVVYAISITRTADDEPLRGVDVVDALPSGYVARGFLGGIECELSGNCSFPELDRGNRTHVINFFGELKPGVSGEITNTALVTVMSLQKRRTASATLTVSNADSNMTSANRNGAAGTAGGGRARPTRTNRASAAAASRIAKVEVAVHRRGRGCQWLKNLDARFKRVKPGASRRCDRPIWLKAKGTVRWRFSLKRRLPRGEYTFLSRATDRAGIFEPSFTSRDRNRRKVKVR